MRQVISGNPASHCLFLSSNDTSTRQVVGRACQWRVDTEKYLLTEGVVTATVKTQYEYAISYTCPPPKVILRLDYQQHHVHVYIHTHAVMVGPDRPVIPGHTQVELYIRPGNWLIWVLLTAYGVCGALLIFPCTSVRMRSMCQGLISTVSAVWISYRGHTANLVPRPSLLCNRFTHDLWLLVSRGGQMSYMTLLCRRREDLGIRLPSTDPASYLTSLMPAVAPRYSCVWLHWLFRMNFLSWLSLMQSCTSSPAWLGCLV